MRLAARYRHRTCGEAVPRGSSCTENVVVALVSSVPFSVAVVGVTLVAGAVAGAASATMVARCASIASIEHSDPLVDAVRRQARFTTARNRAFSPVDERATCPSSAASARTRSATAAPEFRVWAPQPGRGHAARRRSRPPARPRRLRRARGHGGGRAGRGLRVRRSTASSSPTRARAGSRTACAGARGCSTRRRSHGPTAA